MAARGSCSLPLRGASVLLTRATGSAEGAARRVRALGGTPLRLPGTRIAAVSDADAARRALHRALQAPLCIFVSPAAVRMAARLQALRPARATRVLAVGAATARALQRAGIAEVMVPPRADSEGLLALAQLDSPPARVGLVGAPDGRALLPETLQARGAQVLAAAVYRRLPPRLDARHARALQTLRGAAYLLLSSNEALENLRTRLPAVAWRRLQRCEVIASSARLAAAARAAGFARVTQAESALQTDLLAATCAVHTRRSRRGGATAPC